MMLLVKGRGLYISFKIFHKPILRFRVIEQLVAADVLTHTGHLCEDSFKVHLETTLPAKTCLSDAYHMAVSQ